MHISLFSSISMLTYYDAAMIAAFISSATMIDVH